MEGRIEVSVPISGSPEQVAGKVSIRRFRPGDEPEVRAICFDTGFQGKPASLWLDTNPALFTDLWLLYYLRETPDQVYVAEQDHKVVGYLAGCVDIPARERYYRWRFPWILLAGFCRGRYRLGRRTLRVLARHLRDGWVHGRPQARSDKPCAEFHCNVREDLRGRRDRFGFLLTRAFLGEMKRLGLTRLRASAVVRKEEAEGRYRFVAKQYEVRPTTIYEEAAAGAYVLVDGYADFEDPELPDWWRRYWAGAQPVEALSGREVPA
jgi:hypothetical protein